MFESEYHKYLNSIALSESQNEIILEKLDSMMFYTGKAAEEIESGAIAAINLVYRFFAGYLDSCDEFEEEAEPSHIDERLLSQNIDLFKYQHNEMAHLMMARINDFYDHVTEAIAPHQMFAFNRALESLYIPSYKFSSRVSCLDYFKAKASVGRMISRKCKAIPTKQALARSLK